MNILSIDTTHRVCGVSLMVDSKFQTATKFVEPGKQAEQLISTIENITQEAKVTYEDLDAIAVNNGPGSFTGIRIGLSAAKGINLVKGTRLVAVSSFESVAKQLLSNDNENKILVVLDAKREQVYVQLFNSDISPLTDAKLMDINDISSINVDDNFILTGNGSKLVEKILCESEYNFTIENQEAISESESIALIAQIKLQSKNGDNNISPLYVRKPDAKKQI